MATEIVTAAATIAVRRNQVRLDILNCQGCVRRGPSTSPVPFHGPTPADVMIVTDHPSDIDERKGRSLTGPAATKFRLAMERVGLDIDRCMVTPAIACHGKYAPDRLQLQSCSRHMGKMVTIADPAIVLTLGANALAATGCSGALNQFHGKSFCPPMGPFKGRIVIPTYHPAAAIRKGGETIGIQIEEDLKYLSFLLEYLSFLLDRNTPSDEYVRYGAIVGKGGKLSHAQRSTF